MHVSIYLADYPREVKTKQQNVISDSHIKEHISYAHDSNIHLHYHLEFKHFLNVILEKANSPKRKTMQQKNTE